jgi:SAM-dependent methyltransferase
MASDDRYFTRMRLKRIALKRLVRLGVAGVLPGSLSANRLPGVVGAVHTLDAMLRPLSERGLAHYKSVGRSAMENIAASLAAAGRAFADVRSCLDIPCGYGRVLRLLQTEIEPSRITACDVDRLAVDFCRSEFGVKGLYSHEDFARLSFPSKYDLIWVGSLMTHVDADRSAALVEALCEALDDGGVLVFTTQGEGCLDEPGLGAYCERFVEIEGEMREEFSRRGFCFAPYEAGGAYGTAVHSREYVERVMRDRFAGRLAPVRFAERGWDGHQDVWAYRRTRSD